MRGVGYDAAVGRERHHGRGHRALVGQVHELITVDGCVDGAPHVRVVERRLLVIRNEPECAAIRRTPDRTLLVPRDEAGIAALGSLEGSDLEGAADIDLIVGEELWNGVDRGGPENHSFDGRHGGGDARFHGPP